MSEDQMPAAFVAPDIDELTPLFPGFEIQGLIATGGMGAVYAAVQKSLERAVAIKILPKEFTQDEAFHAGFESEAKAMARLNHPNLIGVYDFGEAGGMLFIIMEYVPGKSLHHSAHGIAIDPSEVIRLVTGICHGLAHAHENGIIHRDIKPSNILLDLNANPKIGDFGLARPAERKIQEGEDIFGTPHYTAPEVVAAPTSVDHRADIFSVGVLLHELLTGRLPADDHRTASAISMCDPRFDAIIRRATDPMPDRRYASAQEIADELHTIATTAGPRVLRTNPTAVPAGTRRRSGKMAASAKKTSTAPLAVILLIIVAIVVVMLKYQSERADAPGTPPAETPSQEDSATENSNSNAADELPASSSDPANATEAETLETQPEPEPPVIEPKSDVPGFMDRARRIMRGRAAPLFSAYDRSLTNNSDACVQSLKLGVIKIEDTDSRTKAEAALAQWQSQHTNGGGQNLAPLTPTLAANPELAALHQQFIEKQTEFALVLSNELAAHSTTYILGIEKQIERLSEQDDPGAIALLRKEIERVRADPDYFTGLMSGGAAGSANE